MDAVYILGSGSRWANNELRYSLRSIQKCMPHDRVFIIGECPAWVEGVTHIPADDPYSQGQGPYKAKNAAHKLSVAANCEDISESFILMNDDFFFLRPVSRVRPYHLGKFARRALRASGNYLASINATREYLKAEWGLASPLDYGVHFPFVYERANLRELLSVAPIEEGLLLRSLYGNLYQVGGSERVDTKVGTVREGKRKVRFANLDLISTNDEVVSSAWWKNFIRTKYPRPGRYEVSAGAALLPSALESLPTVAA